MFGEYAFYADGKVVALVCDDQFFLKHSSADAAFADKCEEAPPYPGAKNSLRVPEELWDDRDWLTEIVRTTTSALPLPKPKKQKIG